MEFKEAFIKCLSILGYKPTTANENVLYSVNRGFPTILLDEDFESSLKIMYVEQNPLYILNAESGGVSAIDKPYTSQSEYMLRGLFKPRFDLMSDEQGPSNS